MAAVIGVCTLHLSIPGNHDLKGKRRVVQSVTARLRDAFNLAVAETDHLDKWQVATLVLATVSNDAGYAHGLLTKAVESLQRSRIDADVADYEIEIF